MSLRLSGYVIIGSVTPGEDPVTTGYVWMDTGTNKLKICTSVSPFTWVEVAGVGGASAWGAITGTLTDQADLQAALADKIGIHGISNNHLVGHVAGADVTEDPYVTLGAGLEFFLSGGVQSGLQITQSYFDALYAALSHTHTEAQITNLVTDLAAKAALVHAVQHKAGGTDTIALDTLAAPTDITTLDASTSAHGLMKKYPNLKYQVLRGDGSFSSSFRRDSPQAWEWYTFGSIAFTGMSFIRGRGTEASPLRAKSGDLISAITGYGYNAVDDVTGAVLDSNATVAIEFSTTAAHTSTSQPGKIALSTTPVGATAPLVRWTIGDDGGLTPTAPAYLNVKLDALVAPDDVTTLDATTLKHGLMMKYPGGTTTFLRADGSWAAVTAVPPVLVGPSNLVSTVEVIAANTYVHVGRQLEIAATGSIEIPATSTLEIST